MANAPKVRLLSPRSRSTRLPETSHYLPVKSFLKGLGYDVKGEVAGCDLVGLKGDDPPIVVIDELKLTFSLELVLQAVDRAAAGDEIWLAACLSSFSSAQRPRCHVATRSADHALWKSTSVDRAIL